LPITQKDIPFFKSLTADQFAAVRDCLREKSFAKGEAVFLEGASCTRIFFVKSGRIKLYRISAKGREQTLETLGPGDTCACHSGSSEWACSSTAEAAAPSTVWYLPRERFVELLQKNVALAGELNRVFAERLRCFSELIEEVSLKDSRHRLVKFLLDLAKEQSGAGKKDEVTLPFTREEIAHRLGIVRETAARQLNDLKRLKFIDMEPRSIVLRDRRGLEKILEK
jgi:CRP/FNR family transcriptional regulator